MTGQVRFEPARPEDDAALRALFAGTAMEGGISVAFHREPSFFLATRTQGAQAEVVLARDTATEAIVAVGTRARRLGWLNGEVREVGYLADARIAVGHRGLILAVQGARELRRLHEAHPIPLSFTVITEENIQALRTIASSRFGFPLYRDLGLLLSPCVNLLRPRPELRKNWELRRASPELIPEIVACLNRFGARRRFAPYYSEAQFGALLSPGAAPPDDGTPELLGLRLEDLWVALRGNRVAGVLGRWDQSAFKQTVVTAYRGALGVLRPVWNSLAGPLRLPRYPPPGRPLSCFYAALAAADDDDPALFAALVRRVYNEACGGRWTYFLLGFHERDPLVAVLSGYRTTPFRGRLFAVHQPEDAAAFEALDGRPPYVELAML